MNEKLTEIEGLIRHPTPQTLSRLLELSYDSDEEVRFRSIEALEKYTVTNEMLCRVRQGLSDVDELVRTTCAELIGDWEDKCSVELLYNCIHDESQLVRSAAITALGQIGRPDTVSFLAGKHPSLSGLERLSSAMALYTLGDSKYLDDVLSCLSDSDYRVRCATANLLSNFIDDDHKGYVITKLKEALLKEQTKAGSSSISDALTEMNGNE
ncbi:HEAT repeat domain-containing protein [Alloalcanivorax sp. C16-2]|uniref:HEAT repeat domain-containing protein n=1 Tax=Alloalcanivorax sp. C16-2 TaxID=3390052 RepID=UPI003970AE5E